MNNNIIRDARLEKAMDTDGFFVVKSFLSDDQLQALENLYAEYRPTDEINKYGFYASTFSANLAYRQRLKEQIPNIFKPSLEKLFADYKFIGANFILKIPGGNSRLEIHQDTSLLDESLFTPVNVWCPMTDVTVENGTLYLLPGSHRFFNSIRIPAIKYPYEDIFPHVLSHLIPIEINRGDAVIFNSGIIHYSPDNQTNLERLVADTCITHQNAQVRIYHKNIDNPDSPLEIINQDDDFLEKFLYFRENIFARPEEGTTIGFIPYSHRMVNEAEFDDLVHKFTNKIAYRQYNFTDDLLKTAYFPASGGMAKLQQLAHKIFHVFQPETS